MIWSLLSLKNPPNPITNKIDNSRHQIKSVITALRHLEYNLMEMLHISTDYDPKLFKLALTLCKNETDDLASNLKVVSEWLTFAADYTEP